MHPQKHQYLTIVLLAMLAPQRLVFYLHLLFSRVSPFFGEKRVKMLRILFTSVEGVRAVCLGWVFAPGPKLVEAEIGHFEYKPAVDNAI